MTGLDATIARAPSGYNAGGQRIGCCAGCRHLFSSDTAFNAHRRVGQCLDPRTVGLVGRPSRTAPGEVIWAFPASDLPWGER